MKHLFILLPCLLLATGAHAGVTGNEDTQKKPQTDAHITGHIVHASTREHLPYITVTIEGTTLGTVADATGHFIFRNLPEGAHTLVAAAVGYTTQARNVLLERGKTLEINFELEEGAIDVDQVVVTSSRNRTTKKGAASVVNVASAKLFETISSVSLADAMSFQPGLRVEMTCGNCGVPQLRINGLEGQYSQVLLDGHPVFSALAGVYGLEQMPVAMVERVEVIRGGGSALFGANAIGGVVNIITKDPLRNTFSLTNNTALFEGGGTDIGTSLGGALVSDNGRAGAYIFAQMRRRSAYDRNDDGFSEIPLLNGETLGARGYFRTSLRSRLTYEYHRMHEFRRGGDQLDKPPHQTLITEQLEHTIDGGGLHYNFWTVDYAHRFSIHAAAQSIDRKSYFGADMDPDAYGRTKDLVASTGAQYTWTTGRLLFLPAEFTAGVEYSYNKLEDNYFHRQHNLSQQVHLVGGYLQNEWKNDLWSILIGARLDKHSLMERVVVSPRANLRYAPVEAVSLRLSYASGYRAPQTYDEDLHVTAVSEKVAVIHNAAGLRPEYSHSVSGSVDLYHNFGRLQTNLLVEGFHTDIKDAFDLVTIGETEEYFNIERRNSAGVKVYGINFETMLGIARVFDLQAGFTWQRSRYKKPFDWAGGQGESVPQRRMFRAPDTYGYFTANIHMAKNLVGSLFGTYTGPMLVQHTLPNGIGGEIYRNEHTRTFFDAGVKIAYTFALTPTISLEINGGVKNVFDSYQPDPDFGATKDAGYIYGPAMPRMYFAGVKFTL